MAAEASREENLSAREYGSCADGGFHENRNRNERTRGQQRRPSGGSATRIALGATQENRAFVRQRSAGNWWNAAPSPHPDGGTLIRCSIETKITVNLELSHRGRDGPVTPNVGTRRKRWRLWKINTDFE